MQIYIVPFSCILAVITTDSQSSPLLELYCVQKITWFSTKFSFVCKVTQHGHWRRTVHSTGFTCRLKHIDPQWIWVCKLSICLTKLYSGIGREIIIVHQRESCYFSTLRDIPLCSLIWSLKPKVNLATPTFCIPGNLMNELLLFSVYQLSN